MYGSIIVGVKVKMLEPMISSISTLTSTAKKVTGEYLAGQYIPKGNYSISDCVSMFDKADPLTAKPIVEKQLSDKELLIKGLPGSVVSVGDDFLEIDRNDIQV